MINKRVSTKTIVIIILVLLLASLLIWFLVFRKSIKVQDSQKSSITCNDGKKYTFQELGLDVKSSEDGTTYSLWGIEDEAKARAACHDGTVLNNEQSLTSGDYENIITGEKNIEHNFKIDFFSKDK